MMRYDHFCTYGLCTHCGRRTRTQRYHSQSGKKQAKVPRSVRRFLRIHDFNFRQLTSKNTAEKKPRASKSTKENPDKDSLTIKRLKSFVVACGVRKVWSKVFAGVDSPSGQIKILKGILADLGMNGRLSMEQAKAIKEKREMAKELGMIPVVSFGL